METFGANVLIQLLIEENSIFCQQSQHWPASTCMSRTKCLFHVQTQNVNLTLANSKLKTTFVN